MSLLGLRSSGQDAACFTSRAVSLSRALLLESLLLSKRSGAAEADLDPLSSSPEPEGRLLIETLMQTRSHPDLIATVRERRRGSKGGSRSGSAGQGESSEFEMASPGSSEYSSTAVEERVWARRIGKTEGKSAVGWDY
jgi:hypothetical protein